jgi:hypothetical protein
MDLLRPFFKLPAFLRKSTGLKSKQLSGAIEKFTKEGKMKQKLTFFLF